MGMKDQKTSSVLIFGGAGFIGSNLARYLLVETDARVHVFDNLTRAGVHHNLEWLHKAAGKSGRLQVTIGDVRDVNLVNKAVSQADEIYHLAAQVAVTASLTDTRCDFAVNLGGIFNVLDAARRSGHKPFILFTSTNKVYGEMKLSQPVMTPTRYTVPNHEGMSESEPLEFHSPYGCSKGAADQYVHDFGRVYGLPTVVLRMSCVAGPRQFGREDQGWVALFLSSALQRKPVIIYGDGRQVRDVLCVHDLVRAFVAIRANLPVTRGEVYNIGGGAENSTSLLELMDLIERFTGHRLEYVTDNRRVADQLFYVTDYRKLQRHTGWQPKIGMRETLQLLRHFWEENQAAIHPKAVASVEPLVMATQLSGRAG